MRIELFLKRTIWIIFLAGCNSMPAQTKDINSDLLTTPTMTFIAPTEHFTLLPDEREITIKELMATNRGCSFPCFWGITPGVTSWEKAAEFLQTIGATIGDLEESPETSYHSVIFKNENLTAGDNFGFLETLEVVDTILASGNLHGSTGRDVKDFVSLWVSYSPVEIINKYGIPSRVLVSSVFAPGQGNTGRHGYILWVFYDNLGFMIRYDGTVADLPTYHICPQFQDDGDITRIDLILQNPSSSSPLELQDAILAKQEIPRIILPIEDAAGINREEFHNLFMRDGMQPCFDTPRETWKIKQ